MLRLASSLRRKSSGGTSSNESSRSPVRKSSLKKNTIWGASEKSPPPKLVVQEAEQKRVEDNSAVKVQSVVRGKSARAEVNGKKKQKKEENEAAAKIQAIKRGQMDRADVAMKRSATNGPLQMLQACTAPLQKCTAGIRAMIEGVQDGSSAIFGQSQAVSAHGAHLSEQDLPHPHPKGQSELPPALEAQLRKLFSKMDSGRDQILSKAEAVEYWGKNFAKINAQAMFNEVDDNGNDTISIDEWLEFWRNVLAQDCYQAEDIAEEVENMLNGGSWVDWQDGRTT